MTKFFFQFKKNLFLAYFWPFSPILGANKRFSKKVDCPAQLHKGFYHHDKIQKNLMIQFQENTQTDGRREGWIDPIS